MADQNVISLLPIPGVQRDGTILDSVAYTDGQWVRFQRKMPKKMGGYFQITDRLRGPINSTYVFSEEGIHYVTLFGPKGIEGVAIDDNGLGGAIVSRSPAGYTEDAEYRWSVDSMYDAAAGSGNSVLLAVPTKPNSTTENGVMYALANDLSQFIDIADANATAAGGVFCAPPYAILYGKDGRVTWSNQNEPQNYTTGDAGTARVTGSKIIQGFSMRTGSGLGGLLWALDAVIRMDYIGGQAIFRFQKLSQSASILTQNTVVEYDGMYFWMGNDRFLMSEGSKVQELPNDTNLNWFYDNLNWSNRHKVWGTKIPRYGEVWWYFPFGDNTECSHAIIYNLREKCWYDVKLPRSSGYHSQTLQFPVSTKSTADNLYRITLSGVTGAFNEEDNVVSSGGGTAQIRREIGSTYYMQLISGELLDAETLTNLTRTGSATIDTIEPTYSLFAHETGQDAIIGENLLAIESYFTTLDFGIPTGGLDPNTRDGQNNWTRLTRIEPDFVQSGDMSIEVVSQEFANSPEVLSEPYIFTPDTERVDMRIQARHLRLKFTSNTQGGHYEMGRTLMHIEPGDNRS